MEGEDDPCAGIGMDEAETILLEESQVMGKIQKNDRRLTKKDALKESLRQERNGACHLDAASLGLC